MPKKTAISSKLLTLPNVITLGRILCIPFVVYYLLSHQPDRALLFFVVAAVSDALDGFVARYMRSRSKLGAYLDPLADKLLFLGTFLTLGYLNIIPFWLIVLSVYRDLIIMLGVAFIRYRKIPIEIKPLFISKLNTLVQSIVVVMFLVMKAFAITTPLIILCAYGLVYINVLTLLISGIGYIRQGAQSIQGYGVFYLMSGIFICLFIVMMNYMIADGTVVCNRLINYFFPPLLRV